MLLNVILGLHMLPANLKVYIALIVMNLIVFLMTVRYNLVNLWFFRL